MHARMRARSAVRARSYRYTLCAVDVRTAVLASAPYVAARPVWRWPELGPRSWAAATVSRAAPSHPALAVHRRHRRHGPRGAPHRAMAHPSAIYARAS